MKTQIGSLGSILDQIFISFREADVRDSFLSHMLMVLRNKGITQGSYKRINDLDCHNIK